MGRYMGLNMLAPIMSNLNNTLLLAFAIEHAYWAALGLGGTVLIGSLLLGGLGGDSDGNSDPGEMDSGVAGHVDGAESHDTGHHAGSSSAAPGIMSPMMLAFFLVCFALVGLMLTEWQSHWGTGSLGPAIGVGAVLSLALRKVVVFIFAGADGGNEPRPGEEIGAEADVLSFIGSKGLGTIAYVVRGMRYTRGARSATGQEFKTGDRVIITQSEHNVCSVAPCRDLAGESGGPKATGR